MPVVIRPHRRTGTAIGAAIVFIAVLAAVALVARLPQHPVTLASFTAALVAVVLMALAALFAYWTYGCWSLRYVLDRDQLTIQWAGNEQSLSLQEVRSVVPGSSAPSPRDIGGVRWPGYYLGRASVPGLGRPGEVLFFSTHRSRQELLYLLTPSFIYALSVPDAAFFTKELELRQHQRPVEAFEQRTRRWLLLDLNLWRDRPLVALMLLGLVSNLALFAYVAFFMPALPFLIPVHYTPLGIVDRVGLKSELLLLPVTGFLVLLLNTGLSVALRRRERLVAYLVILGALVMQGVLWAAARLLLG